MDIAVQRTKSQLAEMVQSNVKVSKLTNFDFTIIEVYHAQAKQKIKFRSAVSILYVSRANLHRFWFGLDSVRLCRYCKGARRQGTNPYACPSEQIAEVLYTINDAVRPATH